MQDHDAVRSMVARINDSSKLAAAFQVPLEGILMPLDRLRTAFFVVLSVWIRADVFSLELIRDICRIGIECMNSSTTLARLPALEVLVSICFPEGEHDRVVRISIDQTVFGNLQSIDLIDDRQSYPVEGIHIVWYRSYEELSKLSPAKL